MLKKLVIIVIILGTVQILHAQNFGKRKMQNRLRDIERVKLIEVLNMDEETSIRFFSRRNEHINSQKALNDSCDSIYSEMKSLISKKDFNEKSHEALLKSLFDYENRLLKERIHFIENLTDVLTIEQKYTFIAFEHNFKKEIQNELRRRGMRNK